MFDESIDRRTLPRAWIWKFAIPAVLALATFVAGTLGTYRYLSVSPEYARLSQSDRLVEAALTSVSFFGLNTGPFPVDQSFPLVAVGRLSGALFVSYAAVLWLGVVFASRLRPVEIALRHRMDRLSASVDEPGHAVVCGLGEDGLELALELRAAGKRVVAIDPDGDSPAVGRARDAGVSVFRGDGTDPGVLCRRAKAHLASEVYVTGDDDSRNANVVRTLARRVDARDASVASDSVRCYADLDAQRLRHHLHERVESVSGLEFHSYSEATATARELLGNRPVDRLAANPDAERVHVVIVGWSDLTRAMLARLCHTLHLEEDVGRAVTVVCRNPERAERDCYDRYPGIDPDDWNDPATGAFVEELFPDVSFTELPTSHERLLSESAELPGRFADGDVLTVVVGDRDGLEVGSLISAVLPRLERYEARHGMDTTVHYYAEELPDDGSDRRFDAAAVDRLTVRPFTVFDAGLDAAAIRGDRRDRLAKRIALFYHLLFEYDADAVESDVDERIAARIGPLGGSFDSVVDAWRDLDDEDVQRLADSCWVALTEHYRDANRYAADHVPLKARLAKRLSGESGVLDRAARPSEAVGDDVIERLARVEHRRWCAEKFLDGWEPLPKDEWAAWADDDRQSRLRARRYHRDLWPLAALDGASANEFAKDVNQVRFVLDELAPETEHD